MHKTYRLISLRVLLPLKDLKICKCSNKVKNVGKGVQPHFFRKKRARWPTVLLPC